jgi:hypothetical protein
MQPISLKIEDRINSLNGELTNAIEHYRRLAQWNYRLALMLMTVTLCASAIAGIGGIFFGLTGQVAGGIALLPGILALGTTVLKPQGRANWHYRKKDSLNALRRRLAYEMPEPPSPDDISAISSSWTELNAKMNEEWERNFTLSWTLFMKHGDQT